jgi:hypothetical protein
MFEDLTDALNHLLNERAWHAPIHIAIVARNGAAMGGTYTQGEEGLDFEKRYQAGDKFAVPINIMLVSNEGDAARVLISPAGPKLTLVQ